MITIDGNNITINEVVRVAIGKEKVQLSEIGRKAMMESRDYIDNCIARGETMYGVNTGFGAFSQIRIDDNQIEELQRNLIRSHCTGVGQPLPTAVVRALMLLRANTLARGNSGVRPVLVEKFIEFLDKDVIPWVPEQGSLGASGDLAPLSHLAICLMGEGYVVGSNGQKVKSLDVLKAKNIEPLVLKAKEGLSLINGCQVMTALGLLTLHEAKLIIKLFDLAAAMTLEATKGSRRPYDPLIPPTRPHPGESKTASNLMKILGESSPIADTHINCARVQDAYSLRCVPAVHGAVRDVVTRSISILERS